MDWAVSAPYEWPATPMRCGSAPGDLVRREAQRYHMAAIGDAQPVLGDRECAREVFMQRRAIRVPQAGTSDRMIERHHEKTGLSPRFAPGLARGEPAADAGGIQDQASAPDASRAAHPQPDIAAGQRIGHRYIQRARGRLRAGAGRHEHTCKRLGRPGGQ